MLDYELTIIANRVLTEIEDRLSWEASEHIVFAEPVTSEGRASVVFQADGPEGAAVIRDCLPAQVTYATKHGDVPVGIEVYHSRGMH